MSNAALDKKILLPTIAIVLLTSAPLIFYASSLQGMIQSIYDFTAKSFGWGYILLYLLGGFFVFFIVINGMKTSGKKRDNLGSIGKSFRRGCNSIAESATKKEGNQPSFFVGG